jgi:hypothetical protein
MSETVALQQLLLSPEGQKLLRYLREFCLPAQGSMYGDPYIIAQISGRRDVYMALVGLLDEPEDQEIVNDE